MVFPSDPIRAYHAKGEIKPRYYNPGDLFDEVHLVSLCDEDIAPEKVQLLVGRAKLFIHPIGRPSMVTFPLFFRRALKMVRRIGPDAIRAHGIWHTGSLAVYAGRKLGVPVVVSLHNEYDEQRKYSGQWIYKLVKPLERYTLGHADCAICITEWVEQFAKRHGARRTEIIYNKVYTDQFEPVERAVNGRLPVILSVMRLDRQKDPACLIRAMQDVDARLVLIGQGELLGELKRLTCELGLADRVEFIPSVPNTEIQKYYQQADIFAMATLYEGFCIPVLEAMAAGVPVVACDTKPLPEVLGGTGMVVERTPDAFREAYSTLLADPQLRRRLARQGRSRAEQVDGRVMEQRERDLYLNVMGVSS